PTRPKENATGDSTNPGPGGTYQSTPVAARRKPTRFWGRRANATTDEPTNNQPTTACTTITSGAGDHSGGKPTPKTSSNTPTSKPSPPIATSTHLWGPSA